MIILSNNSTRRRSLLMAGAGTAAGAILTAVGIPVLLTLSVSIFATAYARGWRLAIRRNPG